MSAPAGPIPVDANERASSATLQRFVRPMPYERWASLAAFLVGLSIFTPFFLLVAMFNYWPNLNNDPYAFVYCLPIILSTAFVARWFSRMASVTRRAVIRSGVVASFKRAGKPTQGEFVGIAYSEKILDLRRGVDWDYGFLDLRSDGLVFEGDRSRFLLTHDCIQRTELKQYQLAGQGWFVRLFVHWSGPSDNPECFSLCFQEGGTSRPSRHAPSEAWRWRIDDWHWNSMGSPVTAEPEFPVDSSPLDSALSLRAPISPRLNALSWVCGIACSLSVTLVLAVAALICGWDWGLGIVVVSFFYGPMLFRSVFLRAFARLSA